MHVFCSLEFEPTTGCDSKHARVLWTSCYRNPDSVQYPVTGAASSRVRFQRKTCAGLLPAPNICLVTVKISTHSGSIWLIHVWAYRCPEWVELFLAISCSSLWKSGLEYIRQIRLGEVYWDPLIHNNHKATVFWKHSLCQVMTWQCTLSENIVVNTSFSRFKNLVNKKRARVLHVLFFETIIGDLIKN